MDFTSITIISFIIITISLIMNFDHLLMTLLCLEGMMLITVLFIPMTILNFSSSIHQTSLILLTFSACEASLGLSMIVKLTRAHGSDMLSSSSINKC